MMKASGVGSRAAGVWSRLLQQLFLICEKLCYGDRMSDGGYQFCVLTSDGLSVEQAFEVFSYPMGDITVRRIPDTEPVFGAMHMLHVHRSAVDWTLVAEWAALVEDLFPGQPRVLALPYLPSARGDKDIPSPAVVNATLAAGTGITDIVTVDPHSPVWLAAMRAAGPGIREHVLPLADIVAAALRADDDRVTHLGVISPDKGAVARATEVATLLGAPVYVASKNREPKTGRLTHYSFDVELAPGNYLVVDDICDGGGTFALLAGAVPDGVVLDLWVTHGGFTKPSYSAEARAPYRRIYTTDSLGTAVAAALHDNQIQVMALQPWITDILAGLGAERAVRPVGVGENR
nr:ribose-phosphate pyrophosphokinase [Mycobacterium sp. 1245499.0]